MFTGIIESLCLFYELRRGGDFYSLSVSTEDFNDPVIGESVAINGICLTLTEKSGNILRFDVSAETLRRTPLKSFRKGRLMNLERSLKMGDRISGHFVYGHVDCTGKLLSRIKKNSEDIFRFRVSDGASYLVEKGSISIDGISLTISRVSPGGVFEVSVIPETVKRTDLATLKTGDNVNIEFDMLIKYLEAVTRNA